MPLLLDLKQAGKHQSSYKLKINTHFLVHLNHTASRQLHLVKNDGIKHNVSTLKLLQSLPELAANYISETLLVIEVMYQIINIDYLNHSVRIPDHQFAVCQSPDLQLCSLFPLIHNLAVQSWF